MSKIHLEKIILIILFFAHSIIARSIIFLFYSPIFVLFYLATLLQQNSKHRSGYKGKTIQYSDHPGMVLVTIPLNGIIISPKADSL